MMNIETYCTKLKRFAEAFRVDDVRTPLQLLHLTVLRAAHGVILQHTVSAIVYFCWGLCWTHLCGVLRPCQ